MFLLYNEYIEVDAELRFIEEEMEKKGYINLNLELITKEPRFIEYVVLHELAHLVFSHHKKSFYQLIENFMPDYKERIKLQHS